MYEQNISVTRRLTEGVASSPRCNLCDDLFFLVWPWLYRKSYAKPSLFFKNSMVVSAITILNDLVDFHFNLKQTGTIRSVVDCTRLFRGVEEQRAKEPFQ